MLYCLSVARKAGWSRCVLLCLSAATLIPLASTAQERRPVLEEVMVTAQKREESLQDVPASVVALSGEAMADANLENMEDIAGFTPNLSVISHPPFTSLSIRGLGSPFDKGFEHSAGLFLDGVYLGRLAFIDSAFLDEQSVEILRGPQGTLFGKNTISGALSVRSNQPSQEPELFAEYQGGAREQEKLSLTGNLPLADNLALRVSGLRNRREGPVYNTTLDRDEGSTDAKLIRGQLRWDINSWLDVTLGATSTEQAFRLGSFQIQTATDDQFALMQTYDPQVEKDLTDYRSSQNYPTETFQDGGKYDIRFNANLWEHEFSWINAKAEITELSLSDLDFSPIPLLFFLNGEDYELYSTELRVVSPLGMFGGKLDYIAGIYYAESETAIDVIIDAAPDPGALVGGLAAVPGATTLGPIAGAVAGGGAGERLLIDGFQESTSSAVYGQATWHFSEQWKLIAGIRASREKKTVDQTLELFTAGTDADGPVFTGPVAAEEYRLLDQRIDEKTSPKVSLSWLPTDDLTIYASVAAGFKGGGYSGSAVRAEIAEVEPEESLTYEIGVKSWLFDGAASANLALFRTEFEDLQLTIFEGSTSRISNAAGAISEGAELEMAFVTGFGVNGNISLAYLDARFTDYENGPCPAGIDPPCDLTGRPLARAPKWKGSMSLNYFNDLGTLPIQITTGFDILYTDAVLLQPDSDPIDREGAYTTNNLRMQLADDEQRWTIQLLLRNVTDVVAKDSSGDIPTLTGAHYGRVITPRELDVSLRFRF